jgi:hypothetical protein
VNVNALRYQLLGKFLHELNNSWNLKKEISLFIMYRCKEAGKTKGGRRNNRRNVLED